MYKPRKNNNNSSKNQSFILRIWVLDMSTS